MTLPKWIDLPPIWLAVFMAFAWFMSSVWAPLGDSLRGVGLLLIAAGVGIAGWAVVNFRRAGTTIVPHREPSTLVETGPFRFSRNPIYLADMLILAGWCLMCGTIAGLILLAPLFAVLERRFIFPEEARLRATLGEPYLRYSKRVRRWL